MVAKAGLGLIGLSAISVGGVALTKPSWLGMGNPMPEFHSLSEDHGFNSGTYSSSTFAEKHTRYLVGVTHKKDSTPQKTNKDWWKWSFERLENKRPSKGKFKKAEKEYGTENGDKDKALNKICEEAYKKTTSELKEESSAGDNDFIKSDIWKYCSPGITNTSKDGYDAGNIGGGSDKETLVSVKASSNDWFWKIRNEDFWASSGTGNWIGSGGTEGSLFKKAYTDNQSNKKPTIKELCGQAYTKQTSSGADNTDAKKFCRLEISA